MLLKLFRQISILEGITTLLLFLVAMPLKYGFGYEALIRPFGMLHGAAFTAYLVAMVVAFVANRVSLVGWLRSVIAAFFPFGTFFNDAWLKRLSGEPHHPGFFTHERLIIIALVSLGGATLIAGNGRNRIEVTTEEAKVTQNPQAVVINGFRRVPDQQIALPWSSDLAVWLGKESALPAGAELLFADAGRALALVPASSNVSTTTADYDRRFLVGITGLAIAQKGRETGAGWGAERLIAETRLSAGGNPDREAALAVLLELGR